MTNILCATQATAVLLPAQRLTAQHMLYML